MQIETVIDRGRYHRSLRPKKICISEEDDDELSKRVIKTVNDFYVFLDELIIKEGRRQVNTEKYDNLNNN